MPSWLSDALFWFFGNLLWDFVLAALVATVIAWLRKNKEAWAAPALYALVSFVAVFILAFTLVGRPLISRSRPETTADNVESNIRAWADTFQLGITKIAPEPGVDFGLRIALKSGTSVEIRKSKENPDFLQATCSLLLTPEHQKILAALTEEQSAVVTLNLSLELARSKIGFTILGPPAHGQPQMQLVQLYKGIPVSGLTASSFASYMDEMDSAIQLSRTATALALDYRVAPITPRAK